MTTNPPGHKVLYKSRWRLGAWSSPPGAVAGLCGFFFLLSRANLIGSQCRSLVPGSWLPTTVAAGQEREVWKCCSAGLSAGMMEGGWSMGFARRLREVAMQLLLVNVWSERRLRRDAVEVEWVLGGMQEEKG